MIQVMLVHAQIADLPKQKIPSDPAGISEINFHALEECTLQHQLPELIEQKVLLPLVAQIVELVAQMRDAFFFEFELASHNLVAIKPIERHKNWRFSLVNQEVPF